MRRRRGESGNSLVELAMVVLPLTIVFAGIVDFGNLQQERISMRTGIREASWNGGRSIYGSDGTCSITGTVADANVRKLICLAKRRAELPDTDVRIRIEIIDPVTDTNSSFGVGKAVMVCAQRKVSSLTGFYASFLNGRVEQMRLDNVIVDVSGGALPAAEGETAFPGRDWNFCDPSAAATK